MGQVLQKLVEDAQSASGIFHMREIQNRIAVAGYNVQSPVAQQGSSKPLDVVGNVIYSRNQHLGDAAIKKTALLGLNNAFAGNCQRIKIPNDVNLDKYQKTYRDAVDKKTNTPLTPEK